MKRQIIEIDETKCNGCGACASSCHEGAIGMIDGKARLLRDDYCDGFGDCLPTCPTGAITFVEREAAAYDEDAVLKNKHLKAAAEAASHSGCPGARMQTLKHESPVTSGCPGTRMKTLSHPSEGNTAPAERMTSALAQWPCQIKLAPINAPFYENARLLIAADCTAYAYANMHQDFMRGHVTLIGCPKLDAIDYSEKLTAIIRENNIEEVTIVRMEVPCCGGLEQAARTALQNSGKFLPWHVVTISVDGNILN